MTHVCLVSSGHVGSNPRLVKEANALAEAGYHAHVIAADLTPEVAGLDRSVLADARWSWQLVSRERPYKHALRVAQQRLTRLAWNAGIRTARTNVLAGNWLTPALGAAACDRPADLYIAHGLAALPAPALNRVFAG